MMQNATIPTQYTLDGFAVPVLRCEACGEWVPKLVSFGLRIVCPDCSRRVTP